jgi:hypothetical protein
VSKNILIASLVGIGIVAIAIAIVLHAQRGAHIELTGKILKVRTAPIDENSSVAAVDFRVTDPANYPFMAKSVTLTVVDAGGKQIDGSTVSEPDAVRIFQGIPLLGPKYNPSLIIGERVAPHQTVDRMSSARFEVPDSVLESRKNLILRIDEVDGRATATFTEK